MQQMGKSSTDNLITDPLLYTLNHDVIEYVHY
jgi:hypothetical protein